VVLFLHFILRDINFEKLLVPADRKPGSYMILFLNRNPWNPFHTLLHLHHSLC